MLVEKVFQHKSLSAHKLIKPSLLCRLHIKHEFIILLKYEQVGQVAQG